MGRLPAPLLIDKTIELDTGATARAIVEGRIRLEGPGEIISFHVADALTGPGVGANLTRGECWVGGTLRLRNAPGGINDGHVFFSGYNYNGGDETFHKGSPVPYADGDGLALYARSATQVLLTARARTRILREPVVPSAVIR